MSWKNLSKQEIWDEYDIIVPNVEEINTGYQIQNEIVLSTLDSHLDLPYGVNGERNTLDLFVPKTVSKPPIIVFIHGGYWHHNSKDTRRFPAGAFLEQGVAWAPINYRFAPAVGMDDIVDDVRRAISWLYINAGAYNYDADQIFVCGNSAGGHLVGMLCATDWQSKYSVPEDVIKGGCSLSGIFDLEPLLFTEPNEWLQMDSGVVQRNSPKNHLPPEGQNLIITCGEDESNEFRRQSHEFAELLRHHGINVNYFEMAGENHYSIIGKLADEKSQLFDAIIKMIKPGQGDSH